ncbi:tautomerase family protein [Solimonas flava]|uniref:tautomerase family protein n=1 Tax=Solimonas flava TaxID=415849 RepID=UPI000410A95C|nr:tautomerase family protein [Solimonas flava]
MPILTIHLAEGQYSQVQCKRLLAEASRIYAEILKSPIERVRAVIELHRPSMAAVGGIPVDESGVRAPYFHFLVLKGRPLEERQRLLQRFTDLIVEILEVDRSLVRGGCWPIEPENWAIAGIPASTVRASELAGRTTGA